MFCNIVLCALQKVLRNWKFFSMMRAQVWRTLIRKERNRKRKGKKNNTFILNEWKWYSMHVLLLLLLLLLCLELYNEFGEIEMSIRFIYQFVHDTVFRTTRNIHSTSTAHKIGVGYLFVYKNVLCFFLTNFFCTLTLILKVSMRKKMDEQKKTIAFMLAGALLRFDRLWCCSYCVWWMHVKKGGKIHLVFVCRMNCINVQHRTVWVMCDL